MFYKTKEEHREHLHKVLTLLIEHELYAQPTNCSFFQEKVTYLGHIVGKGGLRVDHKKVEALEKWDVPQDVGQLRSFQGLTN